MLCKKGEKNILESPGTQVQPHLVCNIPLPTVSVLVLH